MNILAFLRNFIQKAKQEAARDFRVAPAGASGGSDETRGWIGMDLDGTLVRSDTPWGIARIGEPIPSMMIFLRKLLAEGARVKIFTARASDPDQVAMIRAWLNEQQLPPLEVTNVKDFDMIRVYDDRSNGIPYNNGLRAGRFVIAGI